VCSSDLVSLHPDLAAVASAPSWRIETDHGPRELGSTNRLVERYQTLAAKTGYTDTAHYCFATVVRTASGRRLAAVVLGAPTTNARFADAQALLQWAEDPTGATKATIAAPPRPAPKKKAPVRRRRR
jgi:D-alanyl-D-alanine carboxypeptidase (penicillin-binding protein 5/6)